MKTARLAEFAVYETKTRLYFVGRTKQQYRILKLDRTTPSELSVTEDETGYTATQIKDLLTMIDTGNKTTGGLKKIAYAYGILGFVRFLQDYYVYLITKASVIAVIGGHQVYQIDSVKLLSLSPSKLSERSPDEQRYVDVFCSVDLTKNFYYSYTYDLTHTLQFNMLNSGSYSKFNDMFVWNHYLLETGFTQGVSKDSPWILPIIHGFIDQTKVSSMGRNIFITLIARRSRQFAGARFLKRGVNDQGYVANEVETEQIVFDGTFMSAPSSSNFTSFVQHRGSIPLFWSQETSNMSPKPPIQINVSDPFYSATALHFDGLFERYSAPIIVLNLVKHKDGRESILLEEYTQAITYLNQFLPEEKRIKYIAFDMSRATKIPGQDVIGILEQMSEETLKKTRFFHSGGEPFFNSLRAQVQEKPFRTNAQYQAGVVRTNCIDCLDRTNAAQFIIGKTALNHQLFALGLIDKPDLSIDSDAMKILMSMYHDHGDTIALQYGGSALVNTMETYRKTGAWSSQSRDMIETIKRYYSNSFTDAEKQDAINLFLGNFVTDQNRPTLWELHTDYYLHHEDPRSKKPRKSYRDWYDPVHLEDPIERARRSMARSKESVNVRDPLAIDFNTNYRVNEYVSFADHFVYNMSMEVANDRIDKSHLLDPGYSPFAVRRQREAKSEVPLPKSGDLADLKQLGTGTVDTSSSTLNESITNPAIFIPPSNATIADRGSAATFPSAGRSQHNPSSTHRSGPPSSSQSQTLATRHLDPQVSFEEQYEYLRYINQFRNPSFEDLDARDSTVNTEKDDYNSQYYEDYLSILRDGPSVDPRDRQIYEEYSSGKGLDLNVSAANIELYRKWLHQSQ